jgi:hypothetical protein
MRIYRSVSSPPPPPPFRLDVLLCIPELVNNQVLVHISPDNHARTRIHPTPPYILLESWLLQFDPNPSSHSSASSSSSHDTPDVAPSTIYKHGIPLFRSFYTLLRILPAWKLYRRLRRKIGGNRNGNLSIQIRLHNTDRDEARVLRFGEPPRCCNAATTSHLPTPSRHTSCSQHISSPDVHSRIPINPTSNGDTHTFRQIPHNARLPTRRTRVPSIIPFSVLRRRPRVYPHAHLQRSTRTKGKSDLRFARQFAHSDRAS